jgi:hypothetical protein
MEKPSIDSRVDEAVKGIEARLPRPVHCPFCHGIDWTPADSLVSVLAFFEGEPSAGREDDVGGIRTLMFACRTCHFIRSHFIADEPRPS